ncbi:MULTISPECIES: DUF58 domain-containing protein [unclassified Glutamicibacter]|uniref:DUF58 domain-containing protein n=1 Tax=unclassified Glutamicibacter TaxID=2627139 RepID=UPI000FFCBCAF|nr:DUF58 domain-containing protein [Glutamicibacter sp. HZAU]RWZ84536.1 DUF58 domain-containing protein [Glutamicibacter sp. HZAU]
MSRRAKRPARNSKLNRGAETSLAMASEAMAVLRDYLGPAIARARELSTRYLAPIATVISPLGFVLLGTAVLLWILGASFGWQEALLGAFMATVLLLASVGFVLGRNDFSVDLDLHRTRVAVGDRAVGAMQVANKASRSSAPVMMELPVGHGAAQFRIPRLEPQQTHEDLFTIPTQRRQVLDVGPVRSVRQDPFAILRRQVKWTESYELFIHPRTTALDGSSAGFIRDLEGMPTADLSNSDVSFHALREYQSGDDRRHIHWKSTARTGELMVRQFEETRRSHLALSLSTNLDEYAEAHAEEDFELAISVAASIGQQAVAEQRKLAILTQQGPVRTGSGRQMMDGLTRIEAATGQRENLVDVVRHTADTVPGASVIFFLTGTRTSAKSLREAWMHVPAGVRAIAIRCETGIEPSRSNIGELTVLSLGKLEELGVMLRKAVA